jgi:hypothetical protein
MAVYYEISLPSNAYVLHRQRDGSRMKGSSEMGVLGGPGLLGKLVLDTTRIFANKDGED